MEVMLRIRRRILSEVWNRHNPTRVESIGQFPVARFLHFDLDNNAVIDEGKSQRTDPWYELVKLADEERLVEPIDLPQYHESDDSLARFPLIESWMPLRPKKLRSLGIDPSKGAKPDPRRGAPVPVRQISQAARPHQGRAQFPEQ
ncbi:hypothetical protein LP419_27240 [Massilia sp. H-1]|nr:hypothetical protein LP419_27240 [Massilia sp. H-1]